MRRARIPRLRGGQRGQVLAVVTEVLNGSDRDLRDHDHAALYHALKGAQHVHCAFVFDTEILDLLADRQDRRVEFIWLSVEELAQSLKEMGGGLQVLVDRAREVIPTLADKLGAQAVYANQDYEPIAKERDAQVSRSLDQRGCVLHTYKDHVIFEKDEVLTQAGRPFTVFAPYKRAWLAKLNPFYCNAYPVGVYRDALARTGSFRVPSLEQIGFRATNLKQMKLPTGMIGARRMFQDFRKRILPPGARGERGFPSSMRQCDNSMTRATYDNAVAKLRCGSAWSISRDTRIP